MPAIVKPTPPRVDCFVADPASVGKPPKKDQWVQYIPQINGPGVARLSQRAVNWINELQSALAKEKTARKDEHACIDSLAEKGVISK